MPIETIRESHEELELEKLQFHPRVLEEIQKRKDKAGKTYDSIDPPEPHRIAYVQGFRAGLKFVLELPGEIIKLQREQKGK